MVGLPEASTAEQSANFVRIFRDNHGRHLGQIGNGVADPPPLLPSLERRLRVPARHKTRRNGPAVYSPSRGPSSCFLASGSNAARSSLSPYVVLGLRLAGHGAIGTNASCVPSLLRSQTATQ
jgi:hypothetical protein